MIKHFRLAAPQGWVGGEDEGKKPLHNLIFLSLLRPYFFQNETECYFLGLTAELLLSGCNEKSSLSFIFVTCFWHSDKFNLLCVKKEMLLRWNKRKTKIELKNCQGRWQNWTANAVLTRFRNAFDLFSASSHVCVHVLFHWNGLKGHTILGVFAYATVL